MAKEEDLIRVKLQITEITFVKLIRREYLQQQVGIYKII
jgi:LPS sulfotransferase NodH